MVFNADEFRLVRIFLWSHCSSVARLMSWYLLSCYVGILQGVLGCSVRLPFGFLSVVLLGQQPGVGRTCHFLQARAQEYLAGGGMVWNWLR